MFILPATQRSTIDLRYEEPAYLQAKKPLPTLIDVGWGDGADEQVVFSIGRGYR